MIPSRESGSHSVSRPAPLKISRASHLIHKSSAGPPSSSSSTSVVSGDRTGDRNQHQQQQPVIIYAYSPKIIHTPARDFMALVQKLTGMSRSDGIGAAVAMAPPERRRSSYSPPRKGNSNSSSNLSEEPIDDLFSPIPLHYYRYPDTSTAISPTTMELMNAFRDF